MPRLLAKSAIFVALLLATAWLLEGWLAARSADHIDAKYREMFSGQDRFNALILGSSRAVHGINPWLLDRPGLRWFNYAYNGSGPIFQAPWYRLYRERHRPPAVVLLAIDWFGLGPDLDRRLEHDSQYLPWPAFWELLRDRRMSRGLLLVNRPALLAQRERAQSELFAAHHPPAMHPLPAGYRDGFVPLATDPGFVLAPDPGRSTQVLPSVAADFRALLAMLRRDGTKIALVAPPSYAPLMHDHAADLAALVREGRAEDLPLLLYDGPLGRQLRGTRENFCDRTHLSERGSQAFSRQLARDLELRGLLPRAAAQLQAPEQQHGQRAQR